MKRRLMRLVPSTKGFTLIEVLVAVVVLSIGLFGVIRTYGEATEAVQRLRVRMVGHWVAMNALDRIKIDTSALRNGSYDYHEEFGPFQWTVEVESETTQIPDIVKVTVRAEPDKISAGQVRMVGFVESDP